ncbi:MAG: nucleotide exchange factor GrpE [Candidatus Riflebacteria bacterium]
MTQKNHQSEPETQENKQAAPGEEIDSTEVAAEENASAAEESEAKDAESAEAMLKKELEDMKARYLRALADYQNIVRRSAKEVLEARNRGVEDFLKKLLPVIDTMDKALEQISKINVDKKVMDGLEMFSFQLTDTLEKEGLKPILAKGQRFDPNFHEAMCKRTIEEVDDEVVLNEFEKGYTFKERVLRTAKVEINQK